MIIHHNIFTCCRMAYNFITYTPTHHNINGAHYYITYILTNTLLTKYI